MPGDHDDAVAEIAFRFWLREMYEQEVDNPARFQDAYKRLDGELIRNPNIRRYVIRRLLAIAGIMIEEDWEVGDFNEPKKENEDGLDA
jgi:hypothetical protein